MSSTPAIALPTLSRQWPHWQSTDVELSIKRRTVLAIGVTALVHILVLYALTRANMQVLVSSEGQMSTLPLVLRLLPDRSANSSTASPSPAKAEDEPQPRQEKPAEPPPPMTPPPPPKRLAMPQPEAAPPPVQPAPQAVDMEDYVRAQREKRRAIDEALGIAPEPEAEAPPPSADALRDATIRRNLQMPGTNGIFTIVNKGSRTAQFAFRGWQGSYSSGRRELIEVEVERGGDLELAIIRRMIEVIRRHYQGNFNWESHRLGRTVVLSARPQHSAELEAFMLREFFGSDYAGQTP